MRNGGIKRRKIKEKGVKWQKEGTRVLGCPGPWEIPSHFSVSKVNANWRAWCWSLQALKTHQLQVCKHLRKQTDSQGFQLKAQGRSQQRSLQPSSKAAQTTHLGGIWRGHHSRIQGKNQRGQNWGGGESKSYFLCQISVSL